MASKSGVTIIVAGEDKTGEVFNAVKKHLDETAASAKKTSASLGQIGDVLKAGLAAAGLTIGLQQLAGDLKQVFTNTMETAMQIGHLSEQTGISVQNLSVLRYAAQATGVDFDVLTRGFKRLAVTVYDADNGNKKATQGFTQLGISADQLRAKGDDMYGVLAMIAQKFHEMPDGIAKSDAAAKIFGARMGSEMIPVLDQLGGKLDDLKSRAQQLGVVWDEDGIKKMEEMHKQTEDLKASFEGLAMEMISNLAPAIEKALGLFGQLMGMGNAASHQQDRAMATLKAVPDEIAGAPDQSKIGNQAAQEKASIEKQLSAVNLSREQRAALQQKWNDADLKQNQAYFVSIEEQITNAEAEIANEKSKHYSTWQDNSAVKERIRSDQAALDDLLAKQKTAMDAIDAAQSRAASAGPLGGPGASGGGGTGGGVGTPASGPTGDQTGNLWLMGDPNAGLSPAFAESIARQKSDAAEAAQLAAQQLADQMKAAQAAMDKAEADEATQILSTIKEKIPQVVLAPQPGNKSGITSSEISGEAEKVAHSVFDPLFNLNESWNQKWKETVKSLKADLGQFMEGQLFGVLFGDPNGRGGKGWMGGSFKGDTSAPGAGGLAKQGTGLLGSLIGSLFKKPAGTTSNGGMAAGAGTIADATASLLQMGKGGAAGAGGIQVVINNQGPPVQATQTSNSGGDGGETQVIQIMLKQLETNGSVAQGIMGMVGAAVGMI